jgi:uroporphyrin-III C-methyltransferase
MGSEHCVYIVGAGPGDPELISVKGAKALMTADVILYDALVDTQLLSYSSDSCKKIFVGKRKGKRAFSQNEINALIVFYAQRYQNVVRLKGGDPFVFGRGQEEVEYASRRGVKVQVIPGISSAIAAPSSAGIPLTRRGVNESFWVVTGTTSSGSLSTDFHHASKSDIIARDRSVDEPMAIIQHATCKKQRTLLTTAGTLLPMIGKEEIITPAVIVIGKVILECDIPKPAFAYATGKLTHNP